MKKNKISIFDKNLSLDEAFGKIKDDAAQKSILRELAIRHIYQQNFEQVDLKEIDSEENKNKLLKSFYKTAKLGNDEDIKKFHEQTKIPEDLLLDQLKYQDKVNKLRDHTITEEAVKEAYLKLKPQLDRVLFRIIRLETEDSAKEIYKKIHNDKEDFAEMAKKHSIGPEAKNGGIIQPRTFSSLNPEVRNKLNDMKDGEISEPFSISDKLYVIVQLIKVERTKLNLKLENQIKGRLFSQWLNNQIDLAKVKLVK